MADRLDLPQVALHSTGALFWQNDKPMIPLKFKCPFGVKLAESLGCKDAVYETNGKGVVKRRPVQEIKLLTKYEGAELQFTRAKGFTDSFRADKLLGFTVENENEKTSLIFQANCEYGDPVLESFVREQGKEPSESLAIIGDQREIDFSAPKRGRPKKNKEQEKAA